MGWPKTQVKSIRAPILETFLCSRFHSEMPLSLRQVAEQRESANKETIMLQKEKGKELLNFYAVIHP